jgi:hypothetical protein
MNARKHYKRKKSFSVDQVASNKLLDASGGSESNDEGGRMKRQRVL